MEKNGKIRLTASEYSQCVSQQVVPSRIKQTWGISDYQELNQGFLANGNFEVVNDEFPTNTNKEET